jgi:hypothetical protein
MDNESDVDRVEQFVRSGNYHAALNIALSCLNECRKNEDQKGVDTFLGVIEWIANTLVLEFGSSEYLGRRKGNY